MGIQFCCRLVSGFNHCTVFVFLDFHIVDADVAGLLQHSVLNVVSTKAEQVELCILYYRMQEYVMFGVSKKIKVTTLYVTKVIYSVFIFML